MLARLDHWPCLLDGISNDVLRRQMLALQLDQPACDARDIQQIVDQTCHVRHLPTDDVTGLANEGRIKRGQAQQLGSCTDGRQRIAQLVCQHR